MSADLSDNRAEPDQFWIFGRADSNIGGGGSDSNIETDNLSSQSYFPIFMAPHLPFCQNAINEYTM